MSKQHESLIEKRSVVVNGRKTSVSLESAFWDVIKRIADESGKRITDIVGQIDSDRDHANLSSALRLFVLDHERRPL
jgi:predicted DNA-binding ribbon-helix-helix protein